MRRNQVRGRIESFIADIGIPAHCVGIREVRPSTEVSIAINGMTHRFSARSGISTAELEQELGRLLGLWRQRVVDGQVDIEDCTKALEPAE